MKLQIQRDPIWRGAVRGAERHCYHPAFISSAQPGKHTDVMCDASLNTDLIHPSSPPPPTPLHHETQIDTQQHAFSIKLTKVDAFFALNRAIHLEEDVTSVLWIRPDPQVRARRASLISFHKDTDARHAYKLTQQTTE